MKKLNLIIGMMFILMIGLVSAESNVLETHFTFDNEANDNINFNGYDFSLVNTVGSPITYVNDVPSVLSSKYTDSLKFVYTDLRQYSSNEAHVDSNFYERDYSLSMWFKGSNATGYGYSLMTSYDSTSYHVMMGNYLGHFAVLEKRYNNQPMMCDLDYNNDEWVLLTVTYDYALNELKLYTNEQECSLSTTPSFIGTPTSKTHVYGSIGAFGDDLYNDYILLSDAKTYGGVLAIEEVIEIFNDGEVLEQDTCLDNNPETWCACNEDLSTWEFNGEIFECYIEQDLTLDYGNYTSLGRMYLRGGVFDGSDSTINHINYGLLVQENTVVQNVNFVGTYFNGNYPSGAVVPSTSPNVSIINVTASNVKWGFYGWGGGYYMENFNIYNSGFMAYGGNTLITDSSCNGDSVHATKLGVEVGAYSAYGVPYNYTLNNFLINCTGYDGFDFSIYNSGSDFENMTLNNVTVGGATMIYGLTYGEAVTKNLEIYNSTFNGGITTDSPDVLFDRGNTYNSYLTMLVGSSLNITVDTETASLTQSYNGSYTIDFNHLDVGSNYVTVQTGTYYDRPSSITFNVNNALFVPYKDGVVCGAECSNINNDGSVLSFDVSGFSTYTYGASGISNVNVYHNATNTITLNSTGYEVFFNWEEAFSPTNTSINYEVYLEKIIPFSVSNLIINLNNTETFYSTDNLNGDYKVMVRARDYLTYSDNYATNNITFCTSEWLAVEGACIDSLRNTTYNDVNNCYLVYDKPSNIIENCTVPTVKEDFNTTQILLITFGVLLVMTFIAFYLNIAWVHVAVALFSALFVTTYIMPVVLETGNGFHIVMILVFLVLGLLNGHLTFKD